jgi:hypothetical protein
MTIKPPPPGNDVARRCGCICAVIDNHYGRGRYGNWRNYGWFRRTDCPVHAAAIEFDSGTPYSLEPDEIDQWLQQQQPSHSTTSTSSKSKRLT